jgi:mRNA interferase MazF
LALEIPSPKFAKQFWVKISQIRTLSVERIGCKLGSVSPEEVARAIEGLNEILGE